MMQLRFFLLLLAILVAGELDADEWTRCRQAAESRPLSRNADCFLQLAAKSDWSRAKRELGGLLQKQPSNPYWHVYLGYLLNRYEGCETSMPRFRQAATEFAKIGNPEEFYARNNLVSCLDRLGEYAAARAEIEKMLEVADHTEKPEENQTRAQLRAVQVAISSGELETAETLLSALPAQLPKENLVIEALLQRGRLDQALGRFSAAVDTYKKLLQMARESGSGNLAARAAYQIASAQSALDVGPENQNALKTSAAVALAEAEKTSDPAVLAPALLLMGRLERNTTHLERCGRIAEKAGDPFHFTACRFAEAAILAADHPAAAETRLAEGLTAGRKAGDPFALLQPWSDYLQACFLLKPRTEALAAAEELLDRADRIAEATRSSERRAEVFAVWRELHAWLAGRLLEGGDSKDVELAYLLLEAARARELRRSLGLALKSLDSLREVEAGLADGEALITFHLGWTEDIFGHPGEGAFAFVSTSEGTRVVSLPGRRELEPGVEYLLGEMETRNEVDALNLRLGELLFADIEKSLPADTRRLILIPDGSLFRLPWSLLRTGRGQWLGARFEITLLPAAALLSKRSLPSGTARALIFADPSLDRATATSAPLPLARARAEGQAIYRLLGGELLEDEEARKEVLQRVDLKGFALLHFATHAMPDHDQPERSALLLASDAGDGRLEAGEIAELPLAGQLVTLAGCRSARGRVLSGEGAMSLGRAFLAAGASTVLGSLWDLRDDEAEVLFRRFYRHLANGETTAAALARTQRELEAEGKAPASWAGVVILGDGDFRLEPPSRMGRLWRTLALEGPLLGIAVLCLVAAVVLGRFKS